MYHLLVDMEMGLTSCNSVFSKAKGLRYSKLNPDSLNPDSFTGLKEPDNQEKYISLLAKTEERV